MSSYLASWRVAVRIGRRDIYRAKGRSAMVAMMVGTPVLLATAVAILVTSSSVSTREGLADTVGSSQASASWIGGSVAQTPDAVNTMSDEEVSDADQITMAEHVSSLERLTDATVLPVERRYSETVVVGDRGFSSDIVAVDAAQPATEGLVHRLSGRAPAAPDEVMVTPRLADEGATIGTDVTIGATSFRVVGTGTIGTVAVRADALGVVALPGALGKATEVSYLIDRADPITWDDVRQLNVAGFVVTSRQVIEHPPEASQIDSRLADADFGNAGSGTERAVVIIAVTAIVLEVVLLAGPAFAVGVSRRRRDLALLASTGASPAQVRRVVLGQALVLGVLSCLLAAVVGLILAAMLVWMLPRIVAQIAFGPLEITWWPMAAAVLLGSVAAIVAAYVPARQASRQEVAAVLAGRRGRVRTSAGWPVLGIVLAAAGLITCFTLGTRRGGEVAVAVAMIGIVVGAVLLTPAAVGAVGRLGGPLPLSLRLAVRDTSRQRSRSAPAVAAVMAAVAGVTTLAIGGSSDFAQDRRDYVYEQSPGRMTVVAGADQLELAGRTASDLADGVRFVPIGWGGSEDWGVEILFDDDGGGSDEPLFGNLYVGEVDDIAAWGVDLSASQRRVLDDGGALVGDRRLLSGESLRVSTYRVDSDDTSEVAVPAAVADLHTGKAPQGPAPQMAGAVITPATAAAQDIPWHVESLISAADSPPVGPAVEKRVDEALKAVSPEFGGAHVERGFQQSFAVPFLALLGFGVVAVLVGTLTATGLALSDARPDFATLAAVGAAPRTRRLVAGAQAWVLATLGTVLGIVVGFGPGIAVTWPLTSESYATGMAVDGGPIIAIPWLLLGAMMVVLPSMAAMVAATFTRGGTVMARRMAS